MKNWLKENWLLIGLALLLALYMAIGIDGCVSKFNYKKQIRQLNKSISEKEKRIKGREAVIGELRKGISERDESIAKRDGLIREKDEEIVSIRKERDSWKGKVEEMTPSEVVVNTRNVLNCANIFERPDGVLFTLACARVNLDALRSGEFSFAQEEVKKLEEKIADMTAKDLLKDAQILDLEKINLKKDKIIADERGAKENWKDKFTLCESEKKKARKKGRKEGSVVGFIIGLVGGILLGR